MRFRLFFNFIFFALLLFLSACAKPIETERSALYHKEEGDKYFASRDYEKAAKAYESALMRAESPEEASSIQLLLADTYFMDKEYADAIPVYEVYLDVYEDSPQAALAYIRAGIAYYELRKDVRKDSTYILKAKEYFEKAERLNPSLAKSYNISRLLSDISEIMAEKELIIASYYKRIWEYGPYERRLKYLVEKYPDTKVYPEACSDLIEFLIKNKKLDEAKKYLDVLKIRYPNDEYTKDADKTLNKALEKAPKEAKN